MTVLRPIALSTVLTLTACGGGLDSGAPSPDPGSDPSSMASLSRYSGPGSFYAASLEADGTFTIDISETLGEPVRISVEGTYERLDSGFLRLTVTQATGPEGEAPEAGVQAYALEVPGFALFLQPVVGGELIPMLIRGACPTSDFRANWAMAQTTEMRDASRPDREWFGTFAYEHGATPRASVDGRYSLGSLAALQTEPRPMEVGACSEGLLQITDGGEVIANMWLTDGGAMVESMNQGQRLQTIFAMRQQTVALADLAGDYSAFVLVDGQPGVQLARASLDANGAGIGAAFDPATGQAEEGMMAFSLRSPNMPDTGWVTGTIDGGDSARNLACSTQAMVSGKSVLFCIGQDPSEPTRSMTFIMVSH